jgi:hypothetical protein
VSQQEASNRAATANLYWQPGLLSAGKQTLQETAMFTSGVAGMSFCSVSSY